MSDPIPEIPPRMNKDIWETYVANRVWEKGISNIIRKNGDYYEAINGSTGKVNYDGADAAAVIQAALDNLTGDRTWQEGIKVKGDIEIDTTITLPSYLYLDLSQAKITLADSSNCTLFSATLKTNITIFGGVVDGNRANNLGVTKGFYFEECTNCLVIGVQVQNLLDRGVQFYDGSENQIAYSKAIYCGTDYQQGFTLEYEDHSSISHCYGLDCLDVNFILAYCNRCSINDCISEASGSYGTTTGAGGVEVYGTGGVECYHCSIENLRLYNVYGGLGFNGAHHCTGTNIISVNPHQISGNPTMSGIGVLVYGSLTTDINLTDVLVVNPEEQGIKVFQGATRVTISNPTLVAGADLNDYVDGIWIVDSSTDVSVNNPRIYDFSGTGNVGRHGVMIEDSVRCKVNGGIITNSKQNAVNLHGSSYCTVNGLTAYDDQGSKTQSYGVGEEASADYNLVAGCDFRGNLRTADPILLIGVHSRAVGNIGFNPQGKITNPFETTTKTIGFFNGDEASPTASTDYTVVGCDIILSSTDSGNSDCVISIKDGSLNAINPVAMSTLDAYYVPVGYVINWGAFTGAAPTVIVCSA